MLQRLLTVLGDHIVLVMDIQGVTTVLGGRTMFGRKDPVVYRKLLTNIQALFLAIRLL